MTRAYGCHPDGRDDRDRNFMLSWFERPAAAWSVPSGPIDLFPWFPPVMYQGQIGSCTTHGVTTALRFNMIDNQLPDVPLSRAQLYYDAGMLEGNTADVGRQIRDVVKVAATQGVATTTTSGTRRRPTRSMRPPRHSRPSTTSAWTSRSRRCARPSLWAAR
jgi:hypothetical protein